MKYSLDKYKYIVHKTKEGKTRVIALSTYAGKTVRGVATCFPKDEFDLEKGKKLAAAKCGLRVAEKRAKRASEKFSEATDESIKAKRHLNKMKNYLLDANEEVTEYEDYIKELLKDM